jgi:hypothetical protein
MNSEDTSGNKKPGRSIRRFLKTLLLIIVIICLGIFSFLYFGIYDEGIRAGVVVRVSKKGVLFKTYEGQLNMETFGALKKNTPFMQSFDFSVAKSRQEVVRELEKVSLSGERVNLHYIKRYIRVPWRGNTKYFIQEVERIEKTTGNEEQGETKSPDTQNVE